MSKLIDILSVGRVVSEDDKFILFEISKNDDESFTLQENDQFYTIIFVRQSSDARLSINGVMPWKPWEHNE